MNATILSERDRASFRFSFVAAFVLCALVLVLKAPDALLMPQFWAEDGVVFFLAQHGRTLPQLFEPYAGYLHFLPRLTAWVASGFPTVHAPLIYNLSAVLLGAAALVSLRRLRVLGLGFLVAVAPIALAPSNGEVWGTVTNVQWLAQFYLVSVLMRLFQGDGESDSIPLLQVPAAIAVGLSGPFVIFAVAAALAGQVWLRLRGVSLRVQDNRRRAPISAEWMALGACACIQLLTIANADNVQSAGKSFHFEPYLLLLKSLQTHVFGRPFMPTMLFLALVGALFVLVLRKSSVAQQASLLALAAFIVLQLAAAAQKSGDQAGLMLSLDHSDRYFFVFRATFWWLFAIALTRSLPRAGRLPAFVVVALLAANASMLPQTLHRRAFPDKHWAGYAVRIDAGEAVEVPINPEPWKMHVPANP